MTQAGTPRLGVFLPTFCDEGGRSGRDIAAFARRAEELGFDSLWATDHLLHGSLFYRVAWLDLLGSHPGRGVVTRADHLPAEAAPPDRDGHATVPGRATVPPRATVPRWWPGLGRPEDEQPGLTRGEHGPQAACCPQAAEHVMDQRDC